MSPIENVDETLPGGTVVNGIANAIRSLMEAGELMPGEQLRQAELAKRLKVSRIPIREALSILMSEHLIIHHPHRGFFVNKVSSEAYSQLRLVRDVLEETALSEMNWPNDAEIRELAALNEKLHKFGYEGDFVRMRELNSYFHQKVLGFSKLSIITSEVMRLRLFIVLYRRLFDWTKAELDRSKREHAEMISALRRKDVAALLDARRSHASAFDRVVVSRMRAARADVRT